MSEPKAYIVYTPREGVVEGLWKSYSVRIEGVEVYLKSEADKVIAELKEQSHQHYERWFNLNKQYEGWLGKVQRCESAENQLRYNKYKRCLAMARWCGDEAYIYKHGSEYDEDLAAWFGKWHKRWLEFAEKYKPNNEVNNG